MAITVALIGDAGVGKLPILFDCNTRDLLKSILVLMELRRQNST